MARIAEPRRVGWFARITYAVSRRRLGRVPGPLKTMAHHPWVLAAVGSFELGLERARTLDERVKALAEIRAATLVGCPF